MATNRMKIEKSGIQVPTIKPGDIRDDGDVPDDVHNAFLDSVKGIHGKNKIAPATRTEPAAEVSEFNLSSKKTSNRSRSEFREDDLIKAIKKKQPRVAQALETVKKKKALRQPLASIHEKKAQRELGFNEVKTQLDRWEDVVMNNRVADQLQFPLQGKKIEIYDCTDTDIFSFTEPTRFEQEFRQVLNQSEVFKDEKEKIEKSKFRLTLKEMAAKRKMIAKAKAQASYQVAKSKRQNKIKSKKYHRILRHEKTKQQLKDFEMLQKTDPEAALKQLEQLEKNRAEERATLRHRNTGKWAQNQMVKAKYDKESRIALSEQLNKNRLLTQKISEATDSDSANSDVEENTTRVNADANNLCLSNTDEYSQFVSSYKKYWEETRNKNENKANDVPTSEDVVTVVDDTCDVTKHSTETPNIEIESSEELKTKLAVPEVPKSIEKNRKEKNRKISKTKTVTSIMTKSGTWNVTEVSTSDHDDDCEVDENIDDMFNSLEKSLNQKFKRKLEDVEELVTDIMEESVPKKTKSNELTIEIENCQKESNNLTSSDSSHTTQLSSNKLIKQVPVASSSKSTENIDPNKFLKVRPKRLATEIPNVMDAGDEGIDDEEEDDASQKYQMTIGEAFAEDDVVAQFQEEKKKVEEESRPQVIENSLPGWGSWTDAEKINRNKETKKRRPRVTNKRLLFRVPKVPPRKDANKGHVIINEEKSDKLKEHMVSELPYPFTKVEDFEANIRAPIGRTWIPETAHQQLIAPAVVTKLGTVIEPIDEGELINRDDS